MSIGNLPAFPSHGSMGEVAQEGMTLRQHYAGLAMQGLLADPETTAGADLVAKVSVQYADALLAELEKQNDPT